MPETQRTIALIFDADDTLYSQIQPFSKALQTVFPEIYTRLSDRIPEVFLASRRYSDEVFEKSATGQMSMEEMYIYRMKNPLRDFGETITDAEALEYQRVYADNLYHLELPAGIEEILNTCLKSDYLQLGVLTNGPSEHQWKKLNSLGITRWIDKNRIIVSGDVGCTKPGREIFEITASRFPQAEEFYMIGDSIATDITGGNAAGWKTIWYNHRHKENHSGIIPTYEVHSEEELGELLRQLF